MNQRKRYVTRTGLLLCLACLAPPLWAAALEQALTLDKKNNQASAAVQQRIDQLDDQQREMLEEYLQLERRIELLRTDNRQLQARTEAQGRHVESLNQQLQEVESTRLGLLPLMQQMQQVLIEFVDADLPFLPEERQSRLARLAAQMEQPDTSDGERYRQLLEAYLTELEYGRTIESYQGVLREPGGEAAATRTVSFFRLGRTGLFYLTLDGSRGGVWNLRTQDWELLDQRYRSELDRALRIARHESVPQLITLPLVGPVQAVAEQGQ